jgi:hypothetical protein
MRLTKNSTKRPLPSQQEVQSSDLNPRVIGGRGIKGGFSKSAEQGKATMIQILIQKRGRLFPTKCLPHSESKEHPSLM